MTKKRATKFAIPMLVTANSVGKNLGCVRKSVKKIALTPKRQIPMNNGNYQSTCNKSTKQSIQVPANTPMIAYAIKRCYVLNFSFR